jgi:hypothetical protein
MIYPSYMTFKVLFFVFRHCSQRMGLKPSSG